MKSSLLSLISSLMVSSLRLIERVLKSAQVRWDEFEVMAEVLDLFRGRSRVKLTVLMG